MNKLICIILSFSVNVTIVACQIPIGGFVVHWQFIGSSMEALVFSESGISGKSSSPYRRINKGALDNPYARGNFSQHMPLNQGNNHIVPEYILTTVPRKDNVIIGGMILATFASTGVPVSDIGNSGHNVVTISCMITTVATFAIVQVWHNRRKKAEFRKY